MFVVQKQALLYMDRNVGAESFGFQVTARNLVSFENLHSTLIRIKGHLPKTRRLSPSFQLLFPGAAVGGREGRTQRE
ncbi:hypothetical protein DV515_00009521 [Chloebia gouldiae]|uniref:Uncharacterized protein n=1 Tax=Chloebia gouldiae TaxID=44316 RepID=A0A3L8SC32_CHLGU|nr:hypothetical protein DV515_00009521 [Chloebia gouldiae]